jgi:hypothetical protein
MAEERVILQVKFDQLRSAGITTPRPAITVPKANGEARQTMDQVMDPLRDLKDQIKGLKDRVAQAKDDAQTIGSAGAPILATLAGARGAAQVAGLSGGAGAAARAALGAAAGAAGAVVAVEAARRSLEVFSDAVNRARQEINQLIDNASELSGVVAQAVGVSERNILLAQRRQALRLEGDLAALVRARSQLEINAIEIRTILADKILPNVTKLTAEAVGALTLATKLFKKLDEWHLLDSTPEKLERLVKRIFGDLAKDWQIPTFIDGVLNAKIPFLAELRKFLRDQALGETEESISEADIDKFFDPASFVPPIIRRRARR